MTSPVARLAALLERRLGRDASGSGVWAASPGALLGHVAVISFVVLVITGGVLAALYDPSTAPVVHRGASSLYHGQTLPAAFSSVVRTSEDVPGGLLTRRVHAAAAHLLVAVLLLHLWRVLATGAARRPRTGNHLVGIGLLLVALGAMFTGELLPFGLVAGASLRIGHAALSSVPLLGEPLALLVFGAATPTGLVIERAHLLHVLLLPAAFAGLTAAHLWLVHRRTPTSPPGADAGTVRGVAPWPDLVRRLTVLGLAVTAVLAVSAALVPWSDLEPDGPFLPAEATNTLHPPWPLFFLSGGLRILPAIDVTLLGLHVSNVLVAGVVLPGLLLGGLAAYPWVERRVLHDTEEHHVRDGVLAVPFRAGALAALATAFVVLSLAATVDVLAFRLSVPAERVVWVFRLALPVAPAAAAWWAVRRSRRHRGRRVHDLERHGPR